MSIVGIVAVLRERLVKAIRSATNPTEPSPESSEDDLDQTGLPPGTPLKNPNSGPVVGKVSIATQTESSLPYFCMLDDLIEAGQLPGYSQDQRDRQGPEPSHDNRLKGNTIIRKSREILREDKFEDYTRINDSRGDCSNSRPGYSDYRHTAELEANNSRFNRNQRNPGRYSDPFPDFDPDNDPYSRGSSTMYPHRSRVTWRSTISFAGRGCQSFWTLVLFSCIVSTLQSRPKPLHPYAYL